MVESREGVGWKEEKYRTDTQIDPQMDTGTDLWRNRESERHIWDGQKTRKDPLREGEKKRERRREQNKDRGLKEG